MAEAFTGAAARRRGLDVEVGSAGILPGARPIPKETLAAIGGGGLDMRGHVSRPLSADLLGGADMVIGMAREHVREAVFLDEACWPKAFTLREIVRRGTLAGPRPAGRPLASWLALIHSGRPRQTLLADDPEDDIADPAGEGRRRVRAAAKEIRALTDRLLELVYP